MTNKTTKDDMPVNIWAYKTTKGFNSNGDIVKTGYLGTGTWIDIDDGCDGDRSTKYTNTEYLKKMIEGMRKYEGDESLALVSNIEYNKALDDVLKLLTP